MKKLLGIVVLGLLWCNVGTAESFFGSLLCQPGNANSLGSWYISIDEKNKKALEGSLPYKLTNKIDEFYLLHENKRIKLEIIIDRITGYYQREMVLKSGVEKGKRTFETGMCDKKDRKF